jgi:molybdenum cofactor cytidylyltransferase
LQYEAYRDACIKANQALYRQYFPQIGCVIMASGLGKRFGGNKLMADFHGKPMIQKALNATEGLFAKRVVVTRHESVSAFCREQNVAVLLHDQPRRSDTVRLGLEALGDLDACMFLPGDQPLLRRETVVKLLQNWQQHPDFMIRPIHEDTEGSPVLFPSWTFPELKNLPEGKGGGVVIRNHPDDLMRVSIPDPFELADADTPETLELLKGLWHD